MNKEIKLRSCPFCGGAVRFNFNADLEPDGITCHKCKYTMWYFRISVAPGETFDIAMNKMADHWNGRVSDGNRDRLM